MIFDKKCGDVSLSVSDGVDDFRWATIEHGSGKLFGLKLEDLRDLRHLIDRALTAAKHK